MKKKKLARGCGIAVGAIGLAVAATLIWHTIRLEQEKPLLVPLGEMVGVDGAEMCVYTAGDGAQTLVFLSGGGTCSPILDFRSLYTLLEEDYRIAVIEKFGYGFSDVTKETKDLDTMLEHDREALAQAGMPAPYVLCPHSLSGIEALYWAQKYPGEVSAVIGLDMAVPAVYAQLQVNPAFLRAFQTAGRMGVTRLLRGSESASAIQSGTLTDEEKDIYRAVYYTRTMTDDMIGEYRCMKESAAEVSDACAVPMLLFCSDGTDTGFSREDWQAGRRAFAEANQASVVYLDCGHYVHNFAYDTIAGEIRGFLQ